jgi:hypothetical protein
MSKRLLRVDVHLTSEGFAVEATDYDGHTVLIERDCAYPTTAIVVDDVKDAVDQIVGAASK